MATRFGSDSTFVASNSGGVFDASGNPVVSADTTFGASPLGIAARSQALYFLANPSFNLLPPDPSASIVDNENALPYWSVDNLSDGKIAATVQYDTTTQTWALRIDPTTAVSGDSMTVRTRSYLLNDTNFSLRQKALASLEKVGTYSSTSQWSLVLSAEYFDGAGNSLSSYAIGTAADNATWTSISGFTTSGSAIVSAAAQYVDLTFTITATATVTNGVKIDVNSLLLQTSTAATGSLLIAQTYTAGTTWTRPTGVDYLVAVVGCGGGGGGASGQIAAGSTTANNSVGSGGGGGATWFIAKDVYVGNQSTVSVGIGAAGAGGSATVFSKAVASTTQAAFARVAGAAGGASTFGSFFSAPGGNGATTAKEGGAASSASTTIIYGAGSAIGAAGGVGGNNSTTPGSSGGVGGLSPYTVIPYSTPSAGSAGSAASGTGGTRVTGTATAGGTAGIIGGGGAGGYSAAGAASALTANATGTNGGGGAGANLSVYIATAGTVTALGGDGGAAGSASGSGGGSGGAVNIATSTVANWTNSNISITSGKGGDGSVGFVTLVYVA
jgi:hypothetical protein